MATRRSPRTAVTVIGVTEREWLPPEDWYASLPSVYVSAGALITDPAGRVLLVKPNYRPYWQFPGGVVEPTEAPHQGCAREVREEVGLVLDVGRLLVVDWIPVHGVRPRPALYFLFDCGVLDQDPRIDLQHEELDGYDFVPPERAVSMLNPPFAGRLPVALSAREQGNTAYLPD
jgi:8-oxo-dGTP pyrophosphatase MutT (NUDIX family)